MDIWMVWGKFYAAFLAAAPGVGSLIFLWNLVASFYASQSEIGAFIVGAIASVIVVGLVATFCFALAYYFIRKPDGPAQPVHSPVPEPRPS